MGKSYVCKSCSNTIHLNHYTVPKNCTCPDCRKAERAGRKHELEEAKNFTSCCRCGETFDRRSSESLRSRTCPSCIEAIEAEKQKKHDNYERFNYLRRSLWASSFINRVNEIVAFYESDEYSQNRWGVEEFIGLMLKESHSDTRRYDSRTTLPFMSMESREVASSERTYDHINGMVPTIKTLGSFVYRKRLTTPEEVISFVDRYSCQIQVSKKLNVNELKKAQGFGHITPEIYYKLSGGMWHKKEKREVSLEEFKSIADNHFISEVVDA